MFIKCLYMAILTANAGTGDKWYDYGADSEEVSLNPIPHGGGGGGCSGRFIHIEIVFFITSVRDTAEPQNLVTFPFSQNLMDNKILNMKMTNFLPESRDMAIFDKSPCQKVVKLRLYCHHISNTCPKQTKTVSFI